MIQTENRLRNPEGQSDDEVERHEHCGKEEEEERGVSEGLRTGEERERREEETN